MKKKLQCLALLLVFAFVFAACGAKDEPQNTPNDVAVLGGSEKDTTTTPEPTSTPEPTAGAEEKVDDVPTAGVPNVTGDDLEVSDMIRRSLMQTGNNYRLKKAIEKARNGEEVVLAYIGGSITEGEGAKPNMYCYAYQSYMYFQDTFGDGGDHVKFVNAGMSGTPSTIGMIRYDRDVVEVAGAEPDILFVEFAVNDGDDPTQGVCYESLVLDALQSENQPAVVLLFSVFKSQWNLQSRLSPVGLHYDLPMISIKDAILPELNSGAMTDADFFADIYHPNNNGHQIMAECINYMFDVVDREVASTTDITIPDTPRIGNAFVGVEMIDSTTTDADIKITPGAFSSVDTTIGSFQHTAGAKTFPDNWMKTASATGDSFKMELTCKNLILLYKSSNNQNFGKAEVYVDGTKVGTLNGYAAGGWNNPLLKILINDDTAAKHTIEVKMAEDNEGKAFTIFGFGYTK